LSAGGAVTPPAFDAEAFYNWLASFDRLVLLGANDPSSDSGASRRTSGDRRAKRVALHSIFRCAAEWAAELKRSFARP
jgi:hypothetical protein